MKIGEYNRICSCADEIINKFKSGEITKHRVVTKVWKHILLMNKEEFMKNQYPVKLIAKNIGAGVYEITMENKID